MVLRPLGDLDDHHARELLSGRTPFVEEERLGRRDLARVSPPSDGFREVRGRDVTEIEVKLGRKVRDVPKDVSELLADLVSERDVGRPVPKQPLVLGQQRAGLSREAQQGHDDRLAFRMPGSGSGAFLSRRTPSRSIPRACPSSSACSSGMRSGA